MPDKKQYGRREVSSEVTFPAKGSPSPAERVPSGCSARVAGNADVGWGGSPCPGLARPDHPTKRSCSLAQPSALVVTPAIQLLASAR